jgi:hypothetical protein
MGDDHRSTFAAVHVRMPNPRASGCAGSRITIESTVEELTNATKEGINMPDSTERADLATRVGITINHQGMLLAGALNLKLNELSAELDEDSIDCLIDLPGFEWEDAELAVVNLTDLVPSLPVEDEDGNWDIDDDDGDRNFTSPAEPHISTGVAADIEAAVETRLAVLRQLSGGSRVSVSRRNVFRRINAALKPHGEHVFSTRRNRDATVWSLIEVDEDDEDAGVLSGPQRRIGEFMSLEQIARRLGALKDHESIAAVDEELEEEDI